MSTITYKGGYVAADSQGTANNLVEELPKLFPLFDGSLVAFCGTYHSCYPFYDWLLTLADKKGTFESFKISPSTQKGKWPELNDASVVFIVDAGIYEFHHDGWDFQEIDHANTDKELAWGSGAQIARGAMAFGASAVQAVEVAKKLDIYTGGKVRYQKVPHHTLPITEQVDD